MNNHGNTKQPHSLQSMLHRASYSQIVHPTSSSTYY